MTALALRPLGWDFRNQLQLRVGTGLEAGGQCGPTHVPLVLS